ncbi:ANTAR domain-containing protein [Cellulomonas sp. 179-A 4D5 NHS]
MTELSPYLHELVVQAAAHFGDHTQASITFAHHGALVRPASSDDRSARCDQVEARTGAGPCIQAMGQLHAVLVPRVLDATWVEWRAQATVEGFVSALAMPARVAPGLDVALNLYSRVTDPWDAQALADADTHAQGIADAIRARLDSPTQLMDIALREALSTRAVIEQAVGVLMHANACTPDEAMASLLEMSTGTDLDVEQVARFVLRTLDVTTYLPEPPSPHPSSD